MKCYFRSNPSRLLLLLLLLLLLIVSYCLCAQLKHHQILHTKGKPEESLKLKFSYETNPQFSGNWFTFIKEILNEKLVFFVQGSRPEHVYGSHLNFSFRGVASNFTLCLSGYQKRPDIRAEGLSVESPGCSTCYSTRQYLFLVSPFF